MTLNRCAHPRRLSVSHLRRCANRGDAIRVTGFTGNSIAARCAERVDNPVNIGCPFVDQRNETVDETSRQWTTKKSRWTTLCSRKYRLTRGFAAIIMVIVPESAHRIERTTQRLRPRWRAVGKVQRNRSRGHIHRATRVANRATGSLFDRRPEQVTAKGVGSDRGDGEPSPTRGCWCRRETDGGGEAAGRSASAGCFGGPATWGDDVLWCGAERIEATPTGREERGSERHRERWHGQPGQREW